MAALLKGCYVLASLIAHPICIVAGTATLLFNAESWLGADPKQNNEALAYLVLTVVAFIGATRLLRGAMALALTAAGLSVPALAGLARGDGSGSGGDGGGWFGDDCSDGGGDGGGGDGGE